jgi:hypothetical protein
MTGSSPPASAQLPMIAAAFGMAVPALIYKLVTGFDPALSSGWAIPAATDIAFALGLLALLGPRVPASIKVLLVTIAIIDDIGAVAIIAVFYTAEINMTALAVSAGWSARWRRSTCSGCGGCGPILLFPFVGWRCSSRASTRPSPAWSRRSPSRSAGASRCRRSRSSSTSSTRW